ncbi:serine protease easter-like [Toxorhynchites rutilus septentrionalis]|uniref:serine protease easter-like n=1 Tax=Toxorhynchites rutilus septentrionalis TaxID=329112 RepID=UPI00247B159A|nr:serine protease easter-like [Toxorhynchites rutilus septentrionalis]
MAIRKEVTCFLFLLLAYLYSGECSSLPQPGACGVDASDRIYGGSVTNIDSYPWTAILIFQNSLNTNLYHCGGSLITNRYVLTAAHCIDGVSEDYNLVGIRLGEWDLKSDTDCNSESICSDAPVDVGIESMVKHADYSRETLVNDVALIKLNESVTFTDYIAPVCLPIPEIAKTKNTDETTFTAVGWGNTEHKNGTYEFGSRYKLHVQLKGVNMTYCNEAYEEEIIDSQLCAGAEKGEDTCQGDSGGGLVAPVDGYYYAYGIVSWGYGCGRKGTPGVYTRVTSFLDWIEKNMDKDDKKNDGKNDDEKNNDDKINEN